MGDSTHKAKIESIFLLKLSHFFENFFMEFVVGIYLKVCTWLFPQKGTTMTFIVHDDGNMSHEEGLLVITLSKMTIHKTNGLP